MSTKFNGVFRVASTPTFIPHATDPNKCLTLINGLENDKRGDQQYTNALSLQFWGANATTAAFYLPVGRQFYCEGNIRSFNKDTGRMLPSGKQEIDNRVYGVVQTLKLLSGDPLKIVAERIGRNIEKMIQNGRWHPDFRPDLTELVAYEQVPKKTEYNHQEALRTGRYGIARVYIGELGGFLDKRPGFVGTGGNGAPGYTGYSVGGAQNGGGGWKNSNAGVSTGAGNADPAMVLAEIQKAEQNIRNMMSQMNGAAGSAGVAESRQEDSPF